MNSGEKKEYHHLLEALSRKGEPALAEYLENVPLFRLTRGRLLNLTLFQPDHHLCLLKGSLDIFIGDSALHQGQKPGGKKNLMSFLPGHVLAMSSVHKFGLALAAGADEVILFPIPEALVLENTPLRDSLDAVLAQIITNLPRQNGEEMDSEPELLKGPIKASVKQCLRQVISYCPQLRETLELGAIPETFWELKSTLQDTDFTVHHESLTWSQLLEVDPEDLPIIVEDADQFCHWIVGIRGHSLHELWFGRSVPFQVENSQERKYNIIRLESNDSVANSPVSAKDLFSMGWYIRLLAKEWLLTCQMVLASILIQGLSLGLPIFSMIIFDRVFGRQNLSTLNVMTVGVLIIVLTEIATKSARTFILAHQLKNLDQIAIRVVLKKLRDAPIGLDRRKERTEKGDGKGGDNKEPTGVSRSQALQNQLRMIPERFSELFKANQTIVSMLLMHVMDAIFSIILMVVLCLLSFDMAVVSLLPLIPIGIEALVTGPKRKKAAAASFKKQRENQLVLTEYLIQSETLQSIYAETFWERNILRRIQDTMREGFAERTQRIGTGNIQGFFGNLGSILALFVGAHEVLEGQISFGVYLAVNMLGRQVVTGTQKFLGAIAEFQEATETTRSFQELFAKEEATQKVQGQTFYMEQVSGELRLVNVHFRYEENLPWILKGVTFTIPAGQKIVLAGRSGSGKTTLLRLLQRFYMPNQGYICLDGINIANMDLESLRQCVGVVNQKPTLFSGTVYENLVMGNPMADLGDVIDILQVVEMEEEIMNQATGLESEVFPFGSNFSGGQTARLALARVLLKQPSLLVMDECLSQVEPAMQAKIYDRLWEWYQKATCLFVTDYLPVHQRADCIIVMHEGQIVEAGSYAELVKANGIYCKLFQPDVSKFQLSSTD